MNLFKVYDDPIRMVNVDVIKYLNIIWMWYIASYLKEKKKQLHLIWKLLN